MSAESWDDYNHKCLEKYFDDIRKLLKNYLLKIERNKENETQTNSGVSPSEDSVNESKEDSRSVVDFLEIPMIDNKKKTRKTDSGNIAAIDKLTSLFGLSKFEKFILVLCAAVELDSKISSLCKKVLDLFSDLSNYGYKKDRNSDIFSADNGYGCVTFGLALATFPEPHWSALAPISSLRRYKLIDSYGYPQTTLTNSLLRINERILHYLTGISYIDSDLLNIVKPIPLDTDLLIVPSHRSTCDSILGILRKECGKEREREEGQLIKKRIRTSARLPIIQLIGTDENSKITIAKSVCKGLGLTLCELDVDIIPRKPEELNTFVQLWTRESSLLGSGLYISANDGVEHSVQLNRLLSADQFDGIVFVSTRDKWDFQGLITDLFEVNKPLKHEQFMIWKFLLGQEINMSVVGYNHKYNNNNIYDYQIRKIIDQFDMNVSSIEAAINDALISSINDNNENNDNNNNTNVTNQEKLVTELWKSCVKVSSPRIGNLAQHIIPIANMADIVLPDRERQLLKDVVVHVKQKGKVYQEWGFENSLLGARGLGLSALFSGESGTGKTMAAEALANELKLHLFRIDLSLVVSKYIGETEKNLRQVFDAAEDGGVILFFDEADALFGKRSEVTTSHDRYANIEVSYLLQRMETYRGLAILATNMKNALDPAFIRRINFIVNFPFPDENSRSEIWKKMFPPSVKTENLDMTRLARLNVSGGNIRNIALYASFLAAESDQPVNMKFIKQAAQTEYDKLGRPLTTSEVGDWPT